MTLSVAAIPRSDFRVFGGPRYQLPFVNAIQTPTFRNGILNADLVLEPSNTDESQTEGLGAGPSQGPENGSIGAGTASQESHPHGIADTIA
jgi:hypothetical protein